MHTNKPILFLVFNRPELTKRVFSAIRRASPPRLYIAADGPREESLSDHKMCSEVREVVSKVDWPCEVHTLFRDENLGCRRAVSSAINWFFENEEAGIILEDDCLPDRTWFRFAEEMLERYRDEERILCISGTHFPGKAHTPEHSYFFSIYNHCWGWATWRRAWKHYEVNLEHWPELKNSNWLIELGNGSRLFERYWTKIFDRIYANAIDSWAYYWTYSVWKLHGLTVLPARNLVVNLGFGPEATHTRARTAITNQMPLESIEFPLIHPTAIAADKQADYWTNRHHFGISPFGDIKRRVAAVPLVGPAIAELARRFRNWR